MPRTRARAAGCRRPRSRKRQVFSGGRMWLIQRGSTTDSGSSSPCASSCRMRMSLAHVSWASDRTSISNANGRPATPAGSGITHSTPPGWKTLSPSLPPSSRMPSRTRLTVATTLSSTFQRPTFAASSMPASRLSQSALSANSNFPAPSASSARAVVPAGGRKRSRTWRVLCPFRPATGTRTACPPTVASIAKAVAGNVSHPAEGLSTTPSSTRRQVSISTS